MNLRKALLEAGDEIEKILEGQIGMQSADDVKFRDSFVVAGGRGFEGLFKSHRVRAGRIFLSSKGTQAARGHADIGRIQMAIDVEVSAIAMHALADVIGHPANRENISGAIEGERVLGIQAFARNNLVMDGP